MKAYSNSGKLKNEYDVELEKQELSELVKLLKSSYLNKEIYNPTFKEMYDKTVRKVKKTVGSIINYNINEIEDVTQNVYTKVHSKILTLKQDGLFIPWINKIALNEAKNYLKKGENKSSSINEEELNEYTNEHSMDHEEYKYKCALKKIKENNRNRYLIGRLCMECEGGVKEVVKENLLKEIRKENNEPYSEQDIYDEYKAFKKDIKDLIIY